MNSAAACLLPAAPTMLLAAVCQRKKKPKQTQLGQVFGSPGAVWWHCHHPAAQLVEGEGTRVVPSPAAGSSCYLRLEKNLAAQHKNPHHGQEQAPKSWVGVWEDWTMGSLSCCPQILVQALPRQQEDGSLSSCLQAELPTAAALTLQAYFRATHSPAQPGAAAFSCSGPGKGSGLNSVWKGLSKIHIRLQNLSISEPCRSQKLLSKKPKVRPHSAFRTLPSQQPGLDGASGSAAF